MNGMENKKKKVLRSSFVIWHFGWWRFWPFDHPFYYGAVVSNRFRARASFVFRYVYAIYPSMYKIQSSACSSSHLSSSIRSSVVISSSFFRHIYSALFFHGKNAEEPTESQPAVLGSFHGRFFVCSFSSFFASFFLFTGVVYIRFPPPPAALFIVVVHYVWSARLVTLEPLALRRTYAGCACACPSSSTSHPKINNYW